MSYGSIIAKRNDGHGFVTGKLISVGKRHGHRVYRVRSEVSGSMLKLSALDYTLHAR